MRGHVGRDLLPGHAAVARAVQVLRAVVDGVLVEGRNLHRRDALEAVGQLAARVAVERLRAYPVLLLIGGRQVERLNWPLQLPYTRSGFARLGIIGPVSQPGPVRKPWPSPKRQAGHDHRRIVLLRAVDAIRILVVHGHLIDFGGRLVILRTPGAAAIQRNVGAAVVRLHHELRVLRIDPDIVVVAMRRVGAAERLAAIGASKPVFVADENDIGIVGIDAQRRVIERPRDDRALRR